MEKTVVVGSLHYDIFVEGPHRPQKGETVMGWRWYPKFGGKGGNQALACRKAGCEVTMVSAVGDDAFAPDLLRVLKEHGINTDHVQRVPGKSGMSVAIADSEGDYGAVVVSGSNQQIDTSLLDQDDLFAGVKMLILQNEVSDAANIAAAAAAKARGVMVCINAAPAKEMPAELAPLIDILIVNQVEASEIAHMQVEDLAQAKIAADVLQQRFPQVIVTAGGDGVAYASAQGSGTLPAHKVKVVSTHGAGDCFVGHLCARLCQGDDLKTAVEFANARAAEHVSTVHEDALL